MADKTAAQTLIGYNWAIYEPIWLEPILIVLGGPKRYYKSLHTSIAVYVYMYISSS